MQGQANIKQRECWLSAPIANYIVMNWIIFKPDPIDQGLFCELKCLDNIGKPFTKREIIRNGRDDQPQNGAI